MTKHEIDEIQVGSLVEYRIRPDDPQPDVGLVNKIIKRGDVTAYCFLWKGSTQLSSQPSTETAETLNTSKFVLVQHADA